MGFLVYSVHGFIPIASVTIQISPYRENVPRGGEFRVPFYELSGILSSKAPSDTYIYPWYNIDCSRVLMLDLVQLKGETASFQDSPSKYQHVKEEKRNSSARCVLFTDA